MNKHLAVWLRHQKVDYFEHYFLTPFVQISWWCHLDNWVFKQLYTLLVARFLVSLDVGSNRPDFAIRQQAHDESNAFLCKHCDVSRDITVIYFSVSCFSKLLAWTLTQSELSKLLLFELVFEHKRIVCLEKP